MSLPSFLWVNKIELACFDKITINIGSYADFELAVLKRVQKNKLSRGERCGIWFKRDPHESKNGLFWFFIPKLKEVLMMMSVPHICMVELKFLKFVIFFDDKVG